uniref:ABC transporter domain-containing protein n=1 Tax=Plectus sambesii TaxID=2011161 RepID=A0A914ULT9_9BILA
MTYTPVIVIPMLVFGGFYINQATIPAYFAWLQWFSYFRYSYEALAINEWTAVDNIQGCIRGGNITCPSNGADVLQSLSFHQDSLIPDMIALLAMAVIIRIIGFLALVVRTLLKNDWINEISNMEEKEICSLRWHNISVFVKENHSTIHRVKTFFDKKKELKSRILDNVSGMVHSGQLLALIGPSGAGKTTLLNILTSRKMQNLDVSGTVVLNNTIVDNESVRSVSSYVQQNDFFIGTLTVKEHLIFSAEMRMPNRSKAERRSKIEQLLRELGLDKCKDSLIGQLGESGISGGERKRLSFACELLSDPMIMFCDEPTSGLDSFMAQQVVRVLQQAANSGKMIICTIHQPSSQVFAMFDQLCLLAQGQVAYFGPRKEALEIFERCRLPCPVNFSPS